MLYFRSRIVSNTRTLFKRILRKTAAAWTAQSAARLVGGEIVRTRPFAAALNVLNVLRPDPTQVSVARVFLLGRPDAGRQRTISRPSRTTRFSPVLIMVGMNIYARVERVSRITDASTSRTRR